MISAQRIVAVIAAAGVAAAIALTPTSDSGAFDAKAGPRHADISARHGHAIR
jgi:hypothetical protein